MALPIAPSIALSIAQCIAPPIGLPIAPPKAQRDCAVEFSTCDGTQANLPAAAHCRCGQVECPQRLALSKRSTDALRPMLDARCSMLNVQRSTLHAAAPRPHAPFALSLSKGSPPAAPPAPRTVRPEPVEGLVPSRPNPTPLTAPICGQKNPSTGKKPAIAPCASNTATQLPRAITGKNLALAALTPNSRSCADNAAACAGYCFSSSAIGLARSSASAIDSAYGSQNSGRWPRAAFALQSGLALTCRWRACALSSGSSPIFENKLFVWQCALELPVLGRLC